MYQKVFYTTRAQLLFLLADRRHPEFGFLSTFSTAIRTYPNALMEALPPMGVKGDKSFFYLPLMVQSGK